MSYLVKAREVVERQDARAALEGPMPTSREEWVFKRILIPSQNDPAVVDVWMVGIRSDGLLRWWYAETVKREVRES